MLFQQNYESITNCLEAITTSQSFDRKASDKARSLLLALTTPTFIVAFCCAKSVMALTAPLFLGLQTVNRDLVDAMESVDFVNNHSGTYIVWMMMSGPARNMAPTRWRINWPMPLEFSYVYIPRLAARQIHRNNVAANNAVD